MFQLYSQNIQAFSYSLQSQFHSFVLWETEMGTCANSIVQQTFRIQRRISIQELRLFSVRVAVSASTIQRISFKNAVTSIIQRVIKLTRLTGTQRLASVRWFMPFHVNTRRVKDAQRNQDLREKCARKKERKRKREKEEPRHSGRALKIHAWPRTLSRTHISWLAKAARLSAICSHPHTSISCVHSSHFRRGRRY